MTRIGRISQRTPLLGFDVDANSKKEHKDSHPFRAIQIVCSPGLKLREETLYLLNQTNLHPLVLS